MILLSEKPDLDKEIEVTASYPKDGKTF